jgi:hypothetical protein
MDIELNYFFVAKHACLAVNRTPNKTAIQATPYRFLTTWPDNGLEKDGAGSGPWERELDAPSTLWWPICAKR